MNKAIMIAVKPKWCAKIMNGDKTIEVRKNKALYKATKKLIEEQGYATFFMYCSKDDKKHLYPAKLLNNHNQVCKTIYEESKIDKRTNYLNGKVVAKFTLRKVEEIYCIPSYKYDVWVHNTNSLNNLQLMKKSCLNQDELTDYLGEEDGGYAYHIEDLVVFDKPKEISEFKRPNPSKNKHLDRYLPVKAPQNFVFVESEE